MSFTISGVTPADARGLAVNNVTAWYQTDEHWRAMWGSMPLDDIIEDSAGRVAHGLVNNREKLRHLKAVDDATGQVIGYGRWLLPDDDDRITWTEAQVPEPTPEEAQSYHASWKSKLNNGRLRGINGSLQMAMGNPLEKAENEILAAQPGPFLVLDYLTVHPDHRRKGVASALVKKGLEQADSVGMKCFVMASMAGKPMYEKLGYEWLRTVETNVSKYGLEEPHRKCFLLRR